MVTARLQNDTHNLLARYLERFA